MLLAEFWCKIGCKCDECEKVAEGVDKAVDRNKRESIADNFGLETISAQNIDFFDVEADVEGEANNVTVVIVAEGANKNKTGGVTIAIVGEDAVSFLLCFSRTWSCNLMLLANFSEYRLQANASAFFLAIRASSTLMLSSNCFINCS